MKSVPIIEIENLTKTFKGSDEAAVKGVSFSSMEKDRKKTVH